MAEGRSVIWAAADSPKGNMTLVPRPMRAKPISEIAGAGEKNTMMTPASMMPARKRAPELGEWVSTKPSAKKPPMACDRATTATATPAMKGPEPNRVTDFKIHDLRHDFASKLLRRTSNLALVKDALAHSDIKSTLRYAHVLGDDIVRGMEGMTTGMVPEQTLSVINGKKAAN